MAQQLPRPKDRVEIYWFSEQPYGHVTDADLEKYASGRLGFPNTHFDPEKAHVLYNQYHEQYALADEVGFDGIMSNEHHASYWCMKPAVNLDAAVIAKVTKKAKIAIVGNVIAVNDPIRMAEEIAMLDCISGGRIVSGFVRELCDVDAECFIALGGRRLKGFAEQVPVFRLEWRKLSSPRATR